MKLFRTENTNGYTDAELSALNEEWAIMVETNALEEYTDEYDIQAKEFSNKVAKK